MSILNGTFDGKGHTITYTGDNPKVKPLFGANQDGLQSTVKNLTVQLPASATVDKTGLTKYNCWGVISSWSPTDNNRIFVHDCVVNGGTITGIGSNDGLIVGKGNLEYTKDAAMTCDSASKLTGNGAITIAEGVTVTLNGTSVNS